VLTWRFWYDSRQSNIGVKNENDKATDGNIEGTGNIGVCTAQAKEHGFPGLDNQPVSPIWHIMFFTCIYVLSAI
jgi:hypothetical protein